LAEAQVEYIGFTTGSDGREYSLRVRRSAEDIDDFTLVIPNAAFVDDRARYQDGPEICFLKLQRALAAGDGLPARRLTVTDAELEDYRAAHTKPQRRFKPSPPVNPPRA